MSVILRPQPQIPVSAPGANRVRYVVKFGDTLHSIADETFEDRRFSGLLVTINRATIKYVVRDDGAYPLIEEGQVLLLPSQMELDNYRRHYLISTREDKNPTSQGSMRLKTSGIQGAEKESKLERSRIRAGISSFLERMLHAANCEPPSLGDSSGRIDSDSRSPYLAVAGDTLIKIALRDPIMKEARLWSLLAQINKLSLDVDENKCPVARLKAGQQLSLPSEREVAEFRQCEQFVPFALESESEEISWSIDSKIPSSDSKPFYESNRRFVRGLSPECRLVGVDYCRSTFALKLESLRDGRWVKLVAYENIDGRAARYTYSVDTPAKVLCLELPPEVLREMACEDLQRNWHFYQDHYYGFRRATASLETCS